MRAPADCPLTATHLEILTLIAIEDLSYKEIASRRGRSESSVRFHLSAAFERLGVASQTQAIVACLRHGWITLPGFSSPEEIQLGRIELLLGELVTAIEDRNEREPLTAAQRAYLQSLFAYLRASAALSDQRRDLMTERLRFVIAEANVRHPTVTTA